MEIKVVIFLPIGFHSQILSLSTVLLVFEMINYLNAGFSRKKIKKDYSGMFCWDFFNLSYIHLKRNSFQACVFCNQIFCCLGN